MAIQNSPNKNKHQLITVLPGDDLTHHILPLNSTPKSKPPKLGDGLSFNPKTHRIHSTLAGRLYHKTSTNTFTILSNTKRYTPKINDRVLVIVEERTGKGGEYYRVTIPSSTCGTALLNSCGFEGATKRNRPNLSTGALLYCRVIVGVDGGNKVGASSGKDAAATAFSETEVTCLVDASDMSGASRKDWMTDEGTYGELKGGSSIQVGLGLARELLNPRNVLLDELGASGIPFEICVGVNGMVWVNSIRPDYTILILNALRNSEVMTEEQVRGMVKALVKTVKLSMIEES